MDRFAARQISPRGILVRNAAVHVLVGLFRNGWRSRPGTIEEAAGLFPGAFPPYFDPTAKSSLPPKSPTSEC